MASDPVPLLLVVGAPGSGKSTLIARWMADAELAHARAVVAEAGDAPLDGHLGAGFTAAARIVTGGCACCERREALVAAVRELAGEAPAPSRILVEATGTADPLPLIEAFEALDGVRLEGVVCVVDALHGATPLDRPEGARQAMVADTIVLAKTDIAEEDALERIEARLAEFNSWATLTRSVEGNASPQMVIAGVNAASGRADRRDHARGEAPSGDHRAGIEVRTLRPQGAIDAAGLRSRLEGFLDQHRETVLRIKGLVAIEGRPGPAVVQAVAGNLDPVRLLARWPDGSGNSLVVIGHGLPAEAIDALDA